MDREKLVENLLTFLPLMHKKLMKGVSTCGISKQQLGLLFHISNEDEKLMSYYSEKMMVPKPNLTLMADKLIEEGLIERTFDLNDRRIINLKITRKGSKYIVEYKEKVRQEIIKKLDLLNDSDAKRLNELIEEMTEIFNQMEL